jgi:HJR/Mrr/RecB family endonuclease
MNFQVALTDDNWFRFLQAQVDVSDVNFWKPGGKTEFRALVPGELLLFKLRSPQDFIVGGAFFLRFTRCPYTLAWHTFGQRNGVANLDEMKKRIEMYRRGPVGPYDSIGCIVLTQPFFWGESQWIPAPADFSKNIVQGKVYKAYSEVARDIWENVSARLRASGTNLIDSAHPQVLGLLGSDGLPLKPRSAEYSQIVMDLSATNGRALALVSKEPELLWKFPPRKFEEIVAELLLKQGYEVELTPPSRDGGFDMYAAKKDGLGQFLYLVECKRYVPPTKVGVEVVRSLHGTVQARRATAGVVVTTSYFTSCAEEFRHSPISDDPTRLHRPPRMVGSP